MRHRKRRSHLNRTAPHRRAMLSNLATALLRHGRVETTLPKAKEVQPLVEKIITLGKKGDRNARQRAFRVVQDKRVLYHVFNDLAERFADRQGGYTRIYKLGYRKGDAAQMALIEVLPGESEDVVEVTERRGGLRGVVDRLRGRRDAAGATSQAEPSQGAPQVAAAESKDSSTQGEADQASGGDGGDAKS